MGISIWSIIIVILMLGILVTVHELGHFFVARAMNIKAYEVSIFVGPAIFKWKRNGVDYSIRCIPFGAYVRFSDFDEEGNPILNDDPQLLLNQSRFKRLIVAIAGPFMNLVLGILVFSIMYMVNGYTSLEIGKAIKGSQLYNQEYNVGDRIIAVNGEHVWTSMDLYYEIDSANSITDTLDITLRNADTGKTYDINLVPEISEKPMLGITHYDNTDNQYNGWEVISVMDDQNDGNPILKTGDFLIAIDGHNVADDDFFDYISNLSTGDSMELTYIRNGMTFTKDCKKSMVTVTNDRGITLKSKRVKSVAGFFDSIREAAFMSITVANVSYRTVADVFEGSEEVYNVVSGPVGVADAVSDVVDDTNYDVGIKFVSIFMFLGIISFGLVITNMLPIPGLDGVQVMLLLIEMIIGKKLSKKTEGVINGAGFVLLISLVLFAFGSDIFRMFF